MTDCWWWADLPLPSMEKAGAVPLPEKTEKRILLLRREKRLPGYLPDVLPLAPSGSVDSQDWKKEEERSEAWQSCLQAGLDLGQGCTHCLPYLPTLVETRHSEEYGLCPKALLPERKKSSDM